MPLPGRRGPGGQGSALCRGRPQRTSTAGSGTPPSRPACARSRGPRWSGTNCRTVAAHSPFAPPFQSRRSLSWRTGRRSRSPRPSRRYPPSSSTPSSSGSETTTRSSSRSTTGPSSPTTSSCSIWSRPRRERSRRRTATTWPSSARGGSPTSSRKSFPAWRRARRRPCRWRSPTTSRGASTVTVKEIKEKGPAGRRRRARSLELGVRDDRRAAGRHRGAAARAAFGGARRPLPSGRASTLSSRRPRSRGSSRSSSAGPPRS